MSTLREIVDAPAEDLFGPGYRTASLGFAALMFLTGFAALALVTTLPVAVRSLDGLRLFAVAYGAFVTAALFGGAVAGDLVDRWGPRPPLLGGLGLSVVALTVCAASGSMWELIAGRLLDGYAGGSVAVAITACIARSYPSQMRPRAMALMSTCWIVPSVIGPPIAGLVTGWLSWRWVFAGLAVSTAAAGLAALAPLNRLRPIEPPEPQPSRGTGRLGRRARVAGLVAAGAGLLQFGTSRWNPVDLCCAAAGMVLLTIGTPRLLPAGTLRCRRGLSTVVLLGAASSGAYFALESFVPMMLIGYRAVPVTLTSVTFTGATLAWAGASRLQGHAWAGISRHRLVFAGMVTVACAAALAELGIAHAVPAPTAGLALVAAGFGMGLAVPALTVLLLDTCPPENQGRYIAATQISQSLGQVTLMALAGAAYTFGTSGGRPGGPAFAAAFGTALVCAVVGCAMAQRTRPAGDHPLEASYAE